MTGSSPSPSSRIQLGVILAIALASVGGAYLLFYLGGGGPWGTTNRGTFVDPPVNVDGLDVRTDSGDSFGTGDSWWLWVVPQGPCEASCEEALYQLRQLHVLLHRDAGRVRRALVIPAGDDRGAAEDYPRLQVLSGNLGSLDRGIYVIDPLGNLVFHYALEDGGEPVLDDLERLLKVSQIG